MNLSIDDNASLQIVTPVGSDTTCWAIRLHPNSGSFYYENMNTGVIVWEDPISLLEGISEAVQADVLEEEEGIEVWIVNHVYFIVGFLFNL